MNKIFVGIQIPDKPQEFIPLANVDFDQDVTYLKERIAEEIKYNDANNLELIFNGHALASDLKISSVGVKPNGIIHCFKKTKEYEPYKPATDKFSSPESVAHIQSLFTLIAHIQINVTSRVTIWQKILNEYPEFRRNLGAQAIIRDSVLFNTTHQIGTIKKIAEHYPIICEAARFIVDTIKKELARNVAATANNLASEAANESPNSSEEENSLGASSSSASLAESGGGGNANAQSERSRIREIMRQQLQDALAQARIANNTNSINSLSNIAQRNADSNTSPAPLTSSASGDRISAEMLRQHLQRAFGMLPRANAPNAASTGSNDVVQPMDIAETTSSSNDGSVEIPTFYRTHEYAEQLRTMSQMGFTNHEDNLNFLNLTNGNIENAVNLLMATMNE